MLPCGLLKLPLDGATKSTIQGSPEYLTELVRADLKLNLFFLIIVKAKLILIYKQTVDRSLKTLKIVK